MFLVLAGASSLAQAQYMWFFSVFTFFHRRKAGGQGTGRIDR